MSHANIVIVGGGIAGVATAYWLSVRYGLTGVVLVDRRQPLSLTTASSGENFRAYWPQPALNALAGRSIDLMEAIADDSAGDFHLKFSGYEFVSEIPGREIFDSAGGGTDRVSLSDPAQITTLRPHLSPAICQLARIERAGQFEVQALGGWLLRQARAAGLQILRGEVVALEEVAGGGFELAIERGNGSDTLEAQQLVLAAGPFTADLAEQLGMTLPIENMLQQKIVVADPQGVIPRDMPFTIYADSQRLDWGEEATELFAADPEFAWLLDEFPPGLHIKPEAGKQIKLGWAYNRVPEAPRWDPAPDPQFPEIVMRGAARFIPGLGTYVENLPTPVRQFAGYYSRTPENLPLIGPLEVDGAYAIAALSGYGTMVACAAGELCAAWVTGSSVPEEAPYLEPARYLDGDLMATIQQTASDGQL